MFKAAGGLQEETSRRVEAGTAPDPLWCDITNNLPPTSFLRGLSRAGGSPPDGHAARARRAIVTRAPITEGTGCVEMIDQVSRSILMNGSQARCKFWLPKEWTLLRWEDEQVAIG